MTATFHQPIKRHGGKKYLAPWIISLMPPRCKNPNAPADDDPGWLHYVEPYFGGGAVLFANDPDGISEVVNDIDGGLVNFYLVLREPHLFQRFTRFVEAMPISQAEWERANAICGMAAFNPVNDEGRVRLAAEFFESVWRNF